MLYYKQIYEYYPIDAIGGLDMRLQISVTENEWETLVNLSTEKGYLDVISYCKDRILQQQDNLKLWDEMNSKISKMNMGEEFTLRDLISNPPSSLGVKLLKNQKTLGIIKVGKDNLNSNIFKRV